MRYNERMEQEKKQRRMHLRRPTTRLPARLMLMQGVVFALALALVARLAYLQLLQNGFYEALASGQRGLYEELYPKRGDILVIDRDGTEAPVATNRYLYLVWADPRRVDDPVRTATVLNELLPVSETTSSGDDEAPEDAAPSRYDLILAKLSREGDPYEPIERKVSEEVAQDIQRANLAGIYTQEERFRLYPEGELFGHVTGFVSPNNEGVFTGKYGVEGHEEERLAGSGGYVFSEADTRGRWIGIGRRKVEPARDGADIVLTIDRTVQFVACRALARAVEQTQADSGTLVILEPKTGAVRAMCGAPGFDPNAYNEAEDIEMYNNRATFSAYEPGSVLKPIVMAGALDVGAVTPQTGYEDKGEVTIDRFTIRNSDLKAHGWQTMTQVLEKSLNTGMIFVMRQMGEAQVARILHAFRLGETTGIEVAAEASGTIASVDSHEEVYAATASYGQGVTVTVLQLAAAYAALANNGLRRAPYLVAEMRTTDGVVARTTSVPEQVVSPKTAQTVAAMLVSVIENGHGKRTKIEGYRLAGKTGTAQVAREDGRGYKTDETIVTFAGFGPVENPSFVAVVRMDHPRTSPWAEATVAPVFREIAQFLLQYDHIPPST